MKMMRKMQDLAPAQPECSMMSSPSWAVACWIPAVVAWAAPVGEAGWQFGLSDIPAASEHPAERWG